MARVKRQSRRFLLAAAFVAAMAGTGALFGGIGGVLLMLLTNAVLGLTVSLMVILPTCVVVGIVVASALGIKLIARPAPPPVPAPVLAWQPAVNPSMSISAASESR